MYQGNLPRLPPHDSTYDAIIVSQVLEHIIRRDLFTREISRNLKPDGEVFFFVPNDCLGPIDEIEHIIKYYVNTFEGFLRRHFDVASIEVIKVANFSMSIPMGQVVRRRGKRLAL